MRESLILLLNFIAGLLKIAQRWISYHRYLKICLKRNSVLKKKNRFLRIIQNFSWKWRSSIKLCSDKGILLCIGKTQELFTVNWWIKMNFWRNGPRNMIKIAITLNLRKRYSLMQLKNVNVSTMSCIKHSRTIFIIKKLTLN